jgi:hypothetical protein
MTTAATKKPDLTEIAAQWREARRLYAVYSALLGRYALGLPPCRELESPVDRADPEVIRNVWNWFAQMDQRVHVHQLRQLVQTTRLGTEENLRALIQRHLAKPEKTDADRDKIDFLLVQYLSTCAPSGFYDRDATLDEMAQVLEPVLGQVGHETPDWLKPLEKATESMDELSSLRDLLEKGTLDQMRKLKAGGGEKYFSPTALAAITRFNSMVRRTFVRLIAADLTAVRGALHELESRGVDQVNCLQAQLSRQESIENLKQIVAEWKKPFRAAYAAGQNFRQLVEIRTAVEQALGVAQPPSAVDEVDIEILGGGVDARVAQPPGSPTRAAFARDGVEAPSAVGSDSPRSAGVPPAGSEASRLRSEEVAPPLSRPSLERQGGIEDAPLTEDAFAGPAFTDAETPRPTRSRGFSGSSAMDDGQSGSGTGRDADSEFAAALAHVQSAAASVEIPVETPSSIASQLFQGAASSSAVDWKPVGDEVDDTPPPPPVARVAQPNSLRSPGSEAPGYHAPAADYASAGLDLHATATSIAEQLVANHVKKGQVATITGADLKLLLSSWEVDAFIAGGNETASGLQRIVAARAMLIQQLEKKKRGEPAHVADAVRLAQAEMTKIQEQIAAAKEKNDIDAAVNMAATCKRLQTLVTEAEKKS